MKKIFLSTYYFWVVTRFIFIVCLLGDFLIAFMANQINLSYLIGLIYSLFLIIIFISDVKHSKQSEAINWITGFISISLALMIIYIKSRHDFDYLKLVAYIFSIWLIFLGFFDFIGVRNYKNKNPQ